MAGACTVYSRVKLLLDLESTIVVILHCCILYFQND